jgi:hypothetical protein
MTRGGKIALVLTVITLGVGGYFIYRKMNKSTSEDFYALKSAIDSKPNSDVFKGLSEAKVKDIEKNFVKHISKSDAKELISIAAMKESEWTSIQKKLFVDSFNKMMGS